LVLSGICIVSGVALVRAARRRTALVEARQTGQSAALQASILRLAQDNAGRLGVVEVSAALGAPLDRADQAMMELVARGACEELVTDAGVSIFRFPELEGLADGKRDMLES
jgi:broad specificity phosphatase PhoE